MGLSTPADFATPILDHKLHEQTLVLTKANIWSRELRKTSVGNAAGRPYPCLGLKSHILAWTLSFSALPLGVRFQKERTKSSLFLKRERPEDGRELVQQLQW